VGREPASPRPYHRSDPQPRGKQGHTMTAKQYLAAIEKLGLSQLAAGRFLGVAPRTAQNYAAKGPPEPVAKLLRLMVRLKLKPEDVA
jgi:hypothetical protein